MIMTAIEKRKAKELKAKLRQRKADAEEARERIKEKKEEAAEAKRAELKQYRDMADKVAKYFANIEDWELEEDLRKARFDFYRHVRINIVDKEDR
jgi:uncharacterized FlgJ-related protein